MRQNEVEDQARHTFSRWRDAGAVLSGPLRGVVRNFLRMSWVLNLLMFWQAVVLLHMLPSFPKFSVDKSLNPRARASAEKLRASGLGLSS